MKYYIKIGVLVLLLSGVTEVAKGADNWKKTDGKWTFSRDAKQQGSRKDNVVKYQLELSPPEGTFIQPTKTNSDMVHDTPGSVKAEKVLDLNTPSSFDYSIKMNGTLKIEGEGSGVLSWSAVENLLEPLRVVELEAVGASASFTAYRGSNEVKVTWSSDSGVKVEPKEGTSTTVSADKGGIYTVTATENGESVSAVFIRLQVIFKNGDGQVVTSQNVVLGTGEILDSELIPESEAGKRKIGLSSSGLITVTGEVPGQVKVLSAGTLGIGHVWAGYNAQAVGALKTNVQTAYIDLSLVP